MKVNLIFFKKLIISISTLKENQNVDKIEKSSTKLVTIYLLAQCVFVHKLFQLDGENGCIND